MKDPALGNPHGAGIHAKFFGHFVRGAAVHNHPPERPPSSFFEIALDQFQGPTKELAVFLSIDVRVVTIGRSIGKGCPPGSGLAAAGGLRLAPPLPEVVSNFIPGDGPQPATERVLGAVSMKAA